jgi:hypothetical protein
MATVTIKGSSRRNLTGSSIKLLDITVNAGDMVVVICGYNSDTSPSSCFFGTQRFRQAGQRVDSTNGFGTTIFATRIVWETTTADFNISWSVDIGARVMAVYTIDETFATWQVVRNLQSNTTSPTSGSTTEHKDRESLAFGVLCAQGPESDVIPSWSAGWVVGERKGTTNEDGNDVTINTAYQLLTTANPISAAATDATARNWANVCTVARPVEPRGTDIFGAPVFSGDIVDYQGTNYTVLDIPLVRNVLLLETVGLVSAVECEVRN